MQLSETVKLFPTSYQKALIATTMAEYISTVNGLVSYAVNGHSIAKTTSADVSANLPSALKNQCIRDAKSIVKKHYKQCYAAVAKNRSLAKRGSAIRVKASRLPVLHKLCCYVNNQNYRVRDNRIDFPVMVNGKSKRISVPVKLTDCQIQTTETRNVHHMDGLMNRRNYHDKQHINNSQQYNNLCNQ